MVWVEVRGVSPVPRVAQLHCSLWCSSSLWPESTDSWDGRFPGLARSATLVLALEGRGRQKVLGNLKGGGKKGQGKEGHKNEAGRNSIGITLLLQSQVFLLDLVRYDWGVVAYWNLHHILQITTGIWQCFAQSIKDWHQADFKRSRKSAGLRPEGWGLPADFLVLLPNGIPTLHGSTDVKASEGVWTSKQERSWICSYITNIQWA